MNVLKKIKKSILLVVINNLLTGTHFFEIKWFLLNQCEGISIGKNNKVVAPIYIPIYSNLEIGDNTWVGKNFSLEGNGTVIIGNQCDLGPDVTCVTGSHRIGSKDRRAGVGYNGTVDIGDGTWIGTKAVLLVNNRIGKGCVVGAASVVTKDIEDNGVYAGCPAKLIRYLDEEEL